MAIAFFWVGYFSSSNSLPLLFPGLIIMGIGIPSVFTPSYALGLNSVSKEKMGVAGGLISALRTCGGTFGVAIFGTILSHVQFDNFARNLQRDPSTRSLDPSYYEGLLSKLGGPMTSLGDPSKTADLVHQYFFSSTVAANEVISYTAMVMALIGALVSICTIGKMRQ